MDCGSRRERASDIPVANSAYMLRHSMSFFGWVRRVYWECYLRLGGKTCVGREADKEE
jgi:hypothetical protein